MKMPYLFPPNQRRSSHSTLVVLFSFVAAVVVLAMAGGIVQAGGPPPVVVDSIEPAELIQGEVPSQPEIHVFGSNFIEGLPSKTNRPTVTLRHVDGLAEFSALAFVNFAGTVATVPPSTWNFLQSPLGVYDVIVTRPTDGASDTLKGAFTVTDGEPEPGEIALVTEGVWGGPVTDVDVVGDLAYVANGRMLRILNVADPANIVEVGSLYIPSGVGGVAVSGNYAFLASSNPYYFAVVDVSDPTNPTLVSAGQGDQGLHVLLYGNLAYVLPETVGSSNGPIRVFDITDPQGVVHLGVVSSVESSAEAIAIVGDLLYVGTQRLPVDEPATYFMMAFRVYDLAADPLNPPLLGEVQFNANDGGGGGGGSTYGVAVEGDYAVWTLRKNHTDLDPVLHMLLVVDISDPTAPVIVGTHNDGSYDSVLTDVVLADGLAYVADTVKNDPRFWAQAKGLAIFDIATDPANPTIIGTFKTHGSVFGVEIIGDRAYLYDDGEGLIILDVSDPAKPVRLGNYHSPSTLREMTKVGDLLYVTDAWNGFTVLDVSNPTHPEAVSVYLAEHFNDLGVNASGITVQDDLAYLGAGHVGLEVVDVSDPVNPALLGAFRVPPPFNASSWIAGVAVSGDVAHVGFEWFNPPFCGASLLNLDISLPSSITQLGEVQIGWCETPLTIELNDQSIAFIGRTIRAQVILDTSDATNPTVIFDSNEIGDVRDVALAGNLLYAASEDNNGSPGLTVGLYVQDVTDPANPVVLLHLDEDYPLGDGIELHAAFALAAQNQRLYVAGRGAFPGAGGNAVLYVFDGSDPTLPVLLDVVPYVGGSRSDVFVDEPNVFVANGVSNGHRGPRTGLVLLELVGLNPIGDLDGDGTVGVKDLLILLGSWGPCADCKLPGDCPADLDDDCSVGVKDLLILLGNWG